MQATDADVLQVLTFEKPMLISFCALMGLALYFPFCGLDIDVICKDLIHRGIIMSIFHFANIYFFVAGMQFLPISTAIIVRVLHPTCPSLFPAAIP
jgi:hypothetical protein